MPNNKNIRAMKHRRKGGLTASPSKLNRSTRYTLASLSDDWMEYLAKRNYSPNSVTMYTYALKRFLEWIDDHGFTNATEITKKVLLSYQSYLYRYEKPGGKPLTVSSQIKELGTIKRFFEYLCKIDIIEANPASVIDLPRKEKPNLPRAFSREEVRAIFGANDITTAVGIRNRAICELVYATGARRTATTNINLQDYDRHNKTMIITGKGGKTRMAPVADSAVYWLNRYLDEARVEFIVDEKEEAFFITGYGSRFNPASLYGTFKRIMKAAGVSQDGGMHRLRHSCCTHMLENGCDIGLIAQVVGHDDISTTQKYTRVTLNSLKVAYQKYHPSNSKDESPHVL